MLILQNLQTQIQKAEQLRKLREGKLQEPNKQEEEIQACTFIQQRMRGIIARKYVENLRSEEMEFLGMTTRKKTAEEERNDPIKKMEQQMKERKNIQEGNWRTY